MGDLILFLSNGHGEDDSAVLILQALRSLAPDLAVTAQPIVGLGKAYIKADVPLIGPTQALPSGGFNTIHVGRLLNPLNWGRDTNPLSLWQDLGAGLVGLTWQQIQAVRRHSRQCDLLFAVGDIVPILFAWTTGRPFGVFLIATSSYYEGTARLPLLTQLALRSPRCRMVVARDAYTAQDLQRRGFDQVTFEGHPIMDALQPSDRALRWGDRPVVALLPGSRLPEAARNLGLMLDLCVLLGHQAPVQPLAALVPDLTGDIVATVAADHGWEVTAPGKLTHGATTVEYFHHAFADILHQCDVVIGMAGTAVEQAVGLGKPIVQIPGPGPQFTYLFAEAQMRLLGPGVQTVGTAPATQATLVEAAQLVHRILQDEAYREECQRLGRDRIGPPGGTIAIAQRILATLNTLKGRSTSPSTGSTTD